MMPEGITVTVDREAGTRHRDGEQTKIGMVMVRAEMSLSQTIVTLWWDPDRAREVAAAILAAADEVERQNGR